MSIDKTELLKCIDFFNKIKVIETDITSEVERVNHFKAVVVDYIYNGITFTTNKLYYKNILHQNNVKNPQNIIKYFGGDVFWLDNEEHFWAKGKGEAELEKTIIDEMVPGENEDFKALLKKIANNNKSGFVQKITADGKTNQYHHNFENNNHWHDIILLIQEIINRKGAKIDKRFFSRLVFKWDGTKHTERERSSLAKEVEWTSREFIDILYKNIKQIQENISDMEILNILKQKGQIILQGAPGTGKTYTAKDLAEQIIFSGITGDKKEQKKRLESSDQFKLIQFHPAYSYEDFVRGIVAKSKGEFIEYLTENKVLAKFAKEANTNYLNSQKPLIVFSEQKWVDDHFLLFCDHVQEELEENDLYKITEKVSIIDLDDDAFRYKGKDGWSILGNRMLFKDIKQAYLDRNMERQDIKHNLNLSGLAHHHASYYIRVLEFFRNFLTEKKYVFIPNGEVKEKPKKYVLIIDEINRANLPSVLGELIYALEYRDEKVESMYAVDGDNSIVVPKNLLIIGTMNTSDRSVGHIDYAIRRRFAFIDVLPKILLVDNFELDLFKQVSGLFIKNYDEYAINKNIELVISEHLSDEFRPEDVWLGHSYFLKNEGDFSLRKKYEIIPILKEYVKDGILKQSAEKIINEL